MSPNPILILGGTADARELAARLAAEGEDVVSSLAGVTASPLLAEGRVRQGGFGGTDGLVSYLRAERISCLIDATHPFAAQMSRQAHEAARAAEVPLLRLERPAWQPEPGDDWLNTASVQDAVLALPPHARAFVTIGRKDIAAFFARGDLSGTARMIEAPLDPVPHNWNVLLQRPPFTEDMEREVLSRSGATHLVAKNSGGEETRAKIIAARRLAIPVVMIARPAKPEVPSYSTAIAAIPAIRRALLP